MTNVVALKQNSRIFEDGIPRVRDLDLAVFLGYAQPRDIRKRIKREIKNLEEFGPVCRAMVARHAPQGGVLEDTEEFWLNEKQAMFIAARGDTAKSDEVLTALVEVFHSYQHGELVPAEPTPKMEVLKVQSEAALIDLRLQRLEFGQGRIEAKIDGNTDTLRRMESKIDGIGGQTGEILRTQQHRRCDVSFHAEATHVSCVANRLNGYCPCCHTVRIVLNGCKTVECEIDHWFGRHQARLSETWVVCRDCNLKLRHAAYHKAKQPEFDAYQATLAVFYGPLFEQ